MKNSLSNLVWGLAFIIIGVGVAGHVMGLWVFDPFFPGWWTVFIILPCGISMLQGGFRVGSTVGFIIGIMLLASHYITLEFDMWQLIVPAVLILIGLRIIFQGSFQRSVRTGKTEYNNENTYTRTEGGSAPKGEYAAIFSSNSARITDSFTGTNLSAIFGGLVLDLRDAVITEDININATAVFGGIDIQVPRGVHVKVNNVPIFGGVSNKTNYQADPGAPVIYLNSTCMFGGIDIK